MAAEQLRMRAEVVDGFTGPLKSLRNQLQTISANPVAKGMSRDWTAVEKNFAGIGRELNTVLRPSLAGIGMQSLGVVGALAGAGLAIKNFAQHRTSLAHLSREVGIMSDRIRAPADLGAKFGVADGAIEGSLKTPPTPCSSPQAVRRCLPRLADDEARRPRRRAGRCERQRGLSRPAAPRPRGRAEPDEPPEDLRMFGLPEELSAAVGKHGSAIVDELRKIQAENAKTSKSTEDAAEKFTNNLAELNRTIQALRDEALAPVLKDINELFAKLREPIGSALPQFFNDARAAILQFNHALAELKRGDAIGAVRELLSDPASKERLKRKEAELGEKQAQRESIERQGRPQFLERYREELDREIPRLTDEVRKLREQIQKDATLQKRSFTQPGGGFDQGGAQFQLPGLRQPGGGFGGFRRGLGLRRGGGGFSPGDAQDSAPGLPEEGRSGPSGRTGSGEDGHGGPPESRRGPIRVPRVVPDGGTGTMEPPGGATGPSRGGLPRGGGGGIRVPSIVPKIPPIGGRPGESLTDLINREAKAAGIDPRIMHGSRAGESL